MSGENQKPLINKVAQSGLITLDLIDYFPKIPVVQIDLAQWLFKGMVLREKDFRQALKDFDWMAYNGTVVGVFCSTEAIVPKWAYMLVMSYLQGIAQRVILGDRSKVEETLLIESLNQRSFEDLKDQKVIIKGCGERDIPDAAYLTISSKLLPIVQSLMFGEACSTVPVFKKKK